MTPTLVVWDRLGRILAPALANDSRRRWVHPVFLDVWDRYLTRSGPPQARLKLQAAIPWLKRCLARMSERGLALALGTDTPFPHLVPGFSLHDELSLYVDAGVAPVDALRAATAGAARVLGVGDKKGAIAPGMAADFVAVRGNPVDRIEDVGAVAWTVRGGRILAPDGLFESFRRMCDRAPDDPITRDLLGYVNGA